ncbi:MAG: ABC transporter ATP-binding protein, partial [Thermoprotei archaeon]
MSKAVEVEDLYFTYLGSRRPSLRGVSFTLDEGETLLIVGPSGAGKS